MEKINLEKILTNHIPSASLNVLKSTYLKDGGDKSVGERLLDAMKEAIKKTLELTAEEARVITYESGFGGQHVNERSSKIAEIGNQEYASVDKKSILDVINQIE